MSRIDFFDGLNKVGHMNLKQDREKNTAEIRFYGTIVSEHGGWLEGGDDKSPSDVVDLLKTIDSDAELNVYINSGGGSVFGGIAIANILKSHNGKTTAYIEGLCASIATVIALACDEVVALKGSMFMIHKPWSGGYGNATDLRKLADVLDRCEDSILDLYEDRVVGDVDRALLQALMEDETWFTSKELPSYFDVSVDEELEAVAMVKPWDMEKLTKIPQDIEFVDLKVDNDGNQDEEELEILKLLVEL